MTPYAGIIWQAEDLQAQHPDWTIEECHKWMQQNQKWFRDALIEYGNEMLSFATK